MMQHLQPLQPHIPQVLRLTIVKFSHTTTAIDHIGPLTWNHVTGNGDLVCIFEKLQGTTSAPATLIQRVVRGDVILENVNLTNLVQMTASRTHSFSSRTMPKFPFAAVVKLPCLAIKYPEGGTHIRRFQIKFTTESDYTTALALLSEIGCPLTEGSTPAPRPTPSVSSWTSGHLSHAPRVVNPSTSVGSIGAPFNHIGAYGSQRTTPLRASSPASTVSYAPCRFGPSPPTFNRLTQNIEPAAMAPLQTIHVPHALYQVPELSSSQISTVSAIHNIDQLNQMLPPKRDLPFQKPPTKKPRSASLTRTTEVRPQPGPFSSSQPTESARSQRVRHPLHAVMQSEPSDLDTSLLECQPRLSSEQNLYPEASQTSLAYGDLLTTQEGPSINRAIEHLAQKPSIQKTPQSRTQTDATKEINNTDGTQDQLLPLPPPPNPNPATPAPAPHTAAVMPEDYLARYITAPTPERVAFLENWMCELIEDDRFMTLCQDVEGTWRRFAFGKK
ncbi:hypothetical protein N7467_011045 [Penicillium canescens]|nr:hypothetical protein N7467_011045 [Penicillium canescens]